MVQFENHDGRDKVGILSGSQAVGMDMNVKGEDAAGDLGSPESRLAAVLSITPVYIGSEICPKRASFENNA